MAEITKVTTPMIPRENLGNKFKPVTDQALDLHDVTKVQKPTDDKNVRDREAGGQALRDNLGRGIVQPLLRDTTELTHAIKRMVSLLQLGISTSDVVTSNPIRELLSSLFVSPEELLGQLQQQEQSAVLFKGEAFDSLRAVLDRFGDNPRVIQALSSLLKTFEQNVNTRNSLKIILYSCRNLLDYMFSQDRAQFSAYLDGLEAILLPGGEPLTSLPQQPAGEGPVPAGGQPIFTEGQPSFAAEQIPPEARENVAAPQGTDARQMPAAALPVLSTDEQKEIAQILKGNLLPLLGEVVVKYHRNERIRDIVMVVVHNIVRVDKGTPEAVWEAVDRLSAELRRVTRLPDGYEEFLGEALARGADRARLCQNDVIDKLAGVIARTLHAEEPNPAALRQAENLLLSLLQNQSSMMNVLHFVLPMQTPEGPTFAELYVDPDGEEHRGKAGERGRKIFLAVESEGYGAFELCFWQSGERVDLSMWCPQRLVQSLSGLRRTVGGIMQVHGYTLGGYSVEEFVRPQTIAQVFPKLLARKVGIDVRV